MIFQSDEDFIAVCIGIIHSCKFNLFMIRTNKLKRNLYIFKPFFFSSQAVISFYTERDLEYPDAAFRIFIQFP